MDFLEGIWNLVCGISNILVNLANYLVGMIVDFQDFLMGAISGLITAPALILPSTPEQAKLANIFQTVGGPLIMPFLAALSGKLMIVLPPVLIYKLIRG